MNDIQLKEHLHTRMVLLCFSLMAAHSVLAMNALPEMRDIHVRGYVGERLKGCVEEHVKKTDGVYLTDPYKWRSEKVYWQTEFWGKWMHSAAPFAMCGENDILKENIARSLENLLPSQLPNGYLGNYDESVRGGRSWDVWGSKYTMLGLIQAYDVLGDARALAAAKKLCDYLMSVFGPGKKDLRKSGEYIGLPSGSTLEPVVWLYNRTKEARYLEFAKYIVSQLNDYSDSPRLVDDALAGVDVGERTPWAKGGYEGQNLGHKAYEMMSCYQGLIEYGLATGEKKYIDAALNTAKSIIKTEVNICGGAASIEHWYHGAENQVYPFCRLQETCVLTTWMRLCAKLLEVTGDPLFADQLEKTFYNAYLAALNRDNSFFATYTPLCGYRSRGQYHCKMHTNCCNANGPRGFVAFLSSYLQAAENAAVMNLYASSTASITLPALKEKVTFETFTLYPAENRVEIWNRTQKPLHFALKLRIPAWSAKTAVRLNGKPLAAPTCGEYLVLDRDWVQGDSITLDFDFSTIAHVIDHHVAFTRGPITLARDRRFNDGDIGEIVRLNCSQMSPADAPFKGALTDGLVFPAKAVRTDNNAMWMACAITLPMGAHRENPENRLPDIVTFCDFASAGNTWDSASSYRVWLPLERFYTKFKK